MGLTKPTENITYYGNKVLYFIILNRNVSICICENLLESSSSETVYHFCSPVEGFYV